MYTIAFEKIKNNYEISKEFYQTDKDHKKSTSTKYVIDYIKKHKDFFHYKYDKKNKKWKIKSKIHPLINLIEELLIANSNKQEIELVKKRFKSNKHKLRGILNKKEFRRLTKDDAFYSVHDILFYIVVNALLCKTAQKISPLFKNKDEIFLKKVMSIKNTELILYSTTIAEKFKNLDQTFRNDLIKINPWGKHIDVLLSQTWETAKIVYNAT